MGPYIGYNEEIPGNTGAIVKKCSPVLDTGLLSEYMRKTACFYLWRGRPSLNIGKKLIIQAKDLIGMAELMFRKFSDVKLDDTELRQEAPPNKKRKLGVFKLPETPPKDTTEDIIRPSTPAPHLPEDSLAVVRYEAYESRESWFLPFTSKIRNPVSSKHRYKDPSNHKRRPAVRKTLPFTSPRTVSSVLVPLERAGNLAYFFKGCVNFVPAWRHSFELDVDQSIKCIGECGKIVCIQDHWIEKGSATQWMGALITFSRSTDSNHVQKMSFLGACPGLLALDVKRHLYLIAQMETKLISMGDEGHLNCSSCVLVEKIPHKASRGKLKEDLRMYGEPEHVRWVENTGMKTSTCEVTYRYAVEAYAVVLAFDGKRFSRSVLRARLKMTEKLRRIHLMVAGSYNN